MNIKKTVMAVAAATLGMTVVTANAYAAGPGQFSYNYVEAQYLKTTTYVGIDLDADIYGIRGSFKLNDTFFLTAGAAYGEVDIPVSNGIDVYDIGINARTSLSDKVDAYVGLSVTYAKVKVATFSDSDTGYGVTAGLRFAATDKIELGASVTYVDVFDDNSTALGLTARYKLTDKFSVGAGYTVAEDTTGYGIGIRLDF